MHSARGADVGGVRCLAQGHLDIGGRESALWTLEQIQVLSWQNCRLLLRVNKCYLLGYFVNILIIFDWRFVSAENTTDAASSPKQVVTEYGTGANPSRRRTGILRSATLTPSSSSLSSLSVTHLPASNLWPTLSSP
ncbi:unnamed protein product [Pleuronectes platessa]|uniref:Uncharacterized protein n=1 Tax=Pleuronectes platessa TaxID=8262 RepID=A0A9N7Y661_PLEPL|nr:unnamed protein product [Pleuronectes platessa]